MNAGRTVGPTTTRRAVGVALLGLVAFGSLGCAGRQQLITSLPSLEEQQATAAAREPSTGPTDSPSIQLIFSEGQPLSAPVQLPPTGNIALVMSDIAGSLSFQRPAVVGAAEGAMQGAVNGASVPLMYSALLGQQASGYVVLMVLGAGLATAPIGAALGAGIGALAAPSRDEVERGTASLGRVFVDMRVSDTLVSHIQEAARRRSIIVSSAGDTVLEIDAPRVSLTSYSAKEWIPDLRLRVSVRFRLIRAADGEELDRWWWEHTGSTARLTVWGKDDAGLFRAELEHALEAVALQAVNRLRP